MAIKTLIRCTHFLARRHITNTTNLDELIDLIVSCSAEVLKRLLERTGKNATYTSKIAVVEFVEQACRYGDSMEQQLFLGNTVMC